MPNGFPNRLPFGQPGTEGERNGHADDEQKTRENKIHKSHAADPFRMAVAEMHHPVGHELAGRAGEVVHENHREHDQSAQGVNGRDP